MYTCIRKSQGRFGNKVKGFFKLKNSRLSQKMKRKERPSSLGRANSKMPDTAAINKRQMVKPSLHRGGALCDIPKDGCEGE